MSCVSCCRSLLAALCALAIAPRAAASPWPAGAGTAIAIPGGEADLSGATWNPVTLSLWVVRQNAQVWEYAYDGGSGTFVQLRTLVLPGAIGSDIEACTQVDPTAGDELYTLAEDQGRLARVQDIDGTATVTHVWNLEVTNNGHALPPETSGAGAEAVAFARDAALLAAGFRYPDGAAFSGSTRGMGGLIFVGHQIEGRLHVFDVNPDVSEDFVNHGSFLTAASEIAGLEFDRASSHMHIWHNPGNVNSWEVSTLSSDLVAGTLDVLELYDSAMPAGNLEGFAIVPRASCGALGSMDPERALFLTMDGGSPNLFVYDDAPCDCSGALNQTGFDTCLLSGDLSAGCICLDLNEDGTVDCEDFAPGTFAQCPEIPLLPPAGRVFLVLLLAGALMGLRRFPGALRTGR